MLTLGLGVASAHPVGMIAGAVAYALGWIYLPDTRWFRRWLEKREGAAGSGRADPEAEAKARELRRSRERLFAALAPERQVAYRALAEVAREIERHLEELPASRQYLPGDLQMQPVDSLMATYLRLLHTQQTLEGFLAREKAEDLEGQKAALQTEIAGLEEQCEAARRNAASEGERCFVLLASRRERLDALEKRCERCREAADKLRLAVAEQERLVDLVKLTRADLITSQDPGAFRQRIDSGARQMGEANAWMSAWDSGEDVDPGFDLIPGARIGYELEGGGAEPPPIPRSARR